MGSNPLCKWTHIEYEYRIYFAMLPVMRNIWLVLILYWIFVALVSKEMRRFIYNIMWNIFHMMALAK